VSDIADFESRIAAALGRINAGLDSMAASGAVDADKETGDLDKLNEALEAEKMANAQLEERVSAIKDKQETTIKEMEERIRSLDEKVAELDIQASNLKQVNQQLEATNEELRIAGEKNVGEADLLNKTMQDELETLRATRKADLAELETIMSELKPMIAGGV